MREVAMQALELRGVRSLREGFDLVYGERAARALQGESLLHLGDWEPKKSSRKHRRKPEAAGAEAGTEAEAERRLSFHIALDDVPPAIGRFLASANVRVSVRQHAVWATAGDEVNVSNHTRMHFLGAEMFKVRPSFRLRVVREGEGSDSVWLDGRIKHHAVLPPLLSLVAETFMAEQSRRQLQRLEDALRTWCADSEK
jgi:hypothetical protein